MKLASLEKGKKKGPGIIGEGKKSASRRPPHSGGLTKKRRANPSRGKKR